MKEILKIIIALIGTIIFLILAFSCTKDEPVCKICTQTQTINVVHRDYPKIEVYTACDEELKLIDSSIITFKVGSYTVTQKIICK